MDLPRDRLLSPDPFLSRSGSSIGIPYLLTALAAGSFFAALLSIYLSRGSTGFAIIWLPNALMIGFFWASKHRSKLAHVSMLFAGVSAANLIYGDPLLLAMSLGAVNGTEFLLAAFAIERLLCFKSPLESHRLYVKFLGFVCVLPAVVAGALGATVVTGLNAGSWLDVYVSWVLGDLVSTLAFAPFFYLAVGGLRAREMPSASESFKFLGWLLVLSLCLIFPLVATIETVRFVFAAPLLAVCALWLRTETISCVTAAFLMLLALVVFFDRTLFQTGIGFGDSQLLFVIAFGCMVVPGNLIACVVSRLKTAERDAQEASRLKSEFLSTMSHEIRTPLNAIMGMFQLIERGEVPDRQKLQAETGYKAATKLLRLLSDILEMSRLEAHAVELWIRECSLETLVSEWRVMGEALVSRSGKQIEFSVKLEGRESGTVRIDENRLGQIMHNLIDNAVRFSEKGAIGVSVKYLAATEEQSQETLEISVSDTGCGIAKDQQGLIFDRFRQTDGSIRRKVGGTGLGLAISKDLIKLMNGTLSVESELGQGTTFRMSIPQAALAT